MLEKVLEELKQCSQVEAIAMGGSRAGALYDEKSDYDIYVYGSNPVSEERRRQILSQECSHMEIGNHFWEYEDNCTLNNGIDLDIIYRNLDGFVRDVSEVVEGFQAHNGYTTCMWHNLITCKIICDKHGRLAQAQERFRIAYPPELKRNIIERNRKLLRYAMPAYEVQIGKAAKRGDLVSVNHRVTEFLASYFDILFAMNEMTHPGEKRLIKICTNQCRLLPKDFEKNLNRLFEDMYGNTECIIHDISCILDEMERLYNQGKIRNIGGCDKV